MKKALKGMYMSFGMFCAVPLPFHIWDDASVRYMLPCLPVVGGFIGLLWWLAARALIYFSVHTVLIAAVLAVFPFVITGFLHLDGYMDTSDAVLSRRPAEDKLRILKDPHTGAFAVIMLAVLFLLQFAAAYAVAEKGESFALLIVVCVVSRCCSALAILCLKPLTQSGYAKMFKNGTGLPHVLFILFLAVISTAIACLTSGIDGFAAVMAVVLGYTAAMLYVYSDLKGVSGDLAGFAMVTAELCGLFALAVI